MMNKEILIVGSGVAGLTAAITLAKAGKSFRIFDKYENYESPGGNITLFPNAIRILRHLDCIDEVKRLGYEAGNAYFRSHNLNSLGSRELNNLIRYNENTFTIRRSALVDLLKNKLHEYGVKIEIDNIQANIIDSKLQTSNFIIYADGANSLNRKILDSSRVSEFQGVVYYGGYFKSDEIYLSKLNDKLKINSNDQAIIMHHSGFLSVSKTFINGSNNQGVHWFTYIKTNEKSKFEIQRIRKTLDLFEVKKQIGSLGFYFTDLISKTEELVVANIKQSVITDRCIGSNYVVIGDAAHSMNPISGQGAGMAIEDGYMVASAISCERITKATLMHVFKIRRKRIASIQRKASRSNSISNITVNFILTHLRYCVLLIYNIVIPCRIQNRFFYFDAVEEMAKIVKKEVR